MNLIKRCRKALESNRGLAEEALQAARVTTVRPAAGVVGGHVDGLRDLFLRPNLLIRN